MNRMSLPLAAGQTIASEKVMFSVNRDYHAQLESYGTTNSPVATRIGREPSPMGMVELDRLLLWPVPSNCTYERGLASSKLAILRV